MALGIGVKLPGGTDENVKVSENDSTAGKLIDKLISSDGSLLFAEVNDGGDEDLDITVDPAVIFAGIPKGTYQAFWAPGAPLQAVNDYGGTAAAFGNPAYTNFDIPADFDALISLQLLIIPLVTKDPHSISLESDYSQIGEASTIHSEFDVRNYALVANVKFGIDLSVVFSNLTAGDNCGFNVINNDIIDDFFCLGIRLKYIT